MIYEFLINTKEASREELLETLRGQEECINIYKKALDLIAKDYDIDINSYIDKIQLMQQDK